MNIRRIWINVVLAVAMLTASYTFPSYANSDIYKEIYVSVNGNDLSDGSKNAPFRSIEKAKEYVSTISDDMTGDIVVHVENGTYYLEDTVVFRNEDSGKNGHTIIYKGENMPLISGGVRVGAFEATEYKGIYRAPVEGVTMMREMYINGVKAYVASSNRTVKAIGYYQNPRTIYDYDGMIMSRADIGEYENPQDIEFSWLVNWKYSTALVDDILPDPDNPDNVIVLMRQDWWDRLGNYTDAGYGGKPYREFEIKNAFELLDKPGEFYYNKKSKYVYYMPREGEDLSTAEVIAPRIDKLFKFDGNDEFDKVKNIRIEGFKIANSAFYGLDEGGMNNAQVQLADRTNGIPWYIPSGISLERSEGIEFVGNYFYGFGSGAIELSDAVDKTVIEGNAFSDIGDAAIAVGKHFQGACSSTSDQSFTDQRVIPPENAKECNLIDGKVKLSASYRDNDNFILLNGSKTWFDKSDENFSGTWESDPNAPARGEKSWIRYDFEGKYTISKIKLGFEDSIPEDKRSGFEIILSNDREFKEENCVVVARQEAPAANIQEYIVDTKGIPYRFLLIRTINPTELAVSRVWAFTSDRKPYTTGVLTTNNTISNNYITRCGETIFSGGGISVIYTRGITIKNNEISYIPYSGIMMGWGWRYFDDTNRDNIIERNFVHDTNLLLDDGGGIYTLSQQDNSVIRENYIKNVIQGRAAIYTDEGSSEFLIENNVMENVVDDYFIWQSSIRNNKYLNGYGWIPQHRSDGTNNIQDDIKIYAPGYAPGEAHEIMQNAGVEEKYEYIKDYVPKRQIEIIDSRSACNYLDSIEIEYIERYLSETTNVMFESGHFGNEPGDYPPYYYYKIKKAVEEVTGYKSNDHFSSLLKARDLINSAVDGINRLSLEDMIIYCEDKLKSTPVSKDRAKENSVTKDVSDNFKNRINRVKKQSKTADNKEKWDLLLELEDANRAFESQKSSQDLVYLYIDNIIDEKIDNDNKVVTVYMPTNTDLTSCGFEAMCSGTSEVAIIEKTLNLDSECIIPVYCRENDKYIFYTLNVVKVDENRWSASAYDRRIINRRSDGKIVLSPYKLAYINSKFFDKFEMQKIVFTPVGTKEQKFSLIFSAGNGEDFDYYSHYAGNDHLRLEIENETGKVIKYENGTGTVIKDNIALHLNYNEKNEIGVRAVYGDNGMYIYSVTVNGKLKSVFITDKKFSSGYVGICSEKMSIVVDGDNA